MTKKSRTKVNRALSHLRQANDLLGGIGLADGVPVFDCCRMIRHNLADIIAGLAPTTAQPAHSGPTPGAAGGAVDA